MSILVQKYGGTSVGSPERIINVAKKIIKTQKETGQQMVVTVSAMGHTTDELVSLAHAVAPNHRTPREMDMLLSTGEQVSIALLTMALHSLGAKATSLTGYQAYIVGEKVHTKARIMEIKTTRIKQHLDLGEIVIIAGFQGITSENEIVTLGRGGSDTTAVAVAAALNAKVCEIYTDVDGVYTGDPRIIPDARKLKEISYEEMLELASLGAQVLHPRAVECASFYDTLIHVRSSFKDDIGTFVKGVKDLEVHNSVSGVTIDNKQAKIAILEVPDEPGMAAKIFSEIASNGFSVDMIIQSVREDQSNDIAFTVDQDQIAEITNLIESITKKYNCGDFLIDENISKVSVVGAGMVGRPGIAAAMFKALGDANINIQMISTSEIKISCVVTKSEGENAAKVIHRELVVDNADEIIRV